MSDSFGNSGSGDNAGQGVPPPPATGLPPAAGQPFLPPTQPVYANPQPTPVYGTTPMTELVSAPAPPTRSRGKMIGVFVAVAALIGAGTFAVVQIGGSDSKGGASSAENVGNDLVKSLDGEDLLGAVDLLLPGERDTFRQPLVDLNKQLKRLEVTNGSLDLSNVPGLDITIKDPVVKARSTNVDDVARVRVTGTATLKVNGKDLPIGAVLTESVFGGKDPKISSDEQTKDFDITFTAVKDGGQWYLSLFYSLAQTLAGSQDIPEKGITPVGAETPDGALDNLINAAGGLDLEGMIASLNPNEASALQRYAPLFLDNAQNRLDKTKATIKVSKAAYVVSGSGDKRQVAITAIKIVAKSAGKQFDIELKNGCITATSDTTNFDSCSGAASQDDSMTGYLDSLNLPDTPALKKLIDDFRVAFSDFEMHGIVVNKVGGKWFVSPIGTVAEFVLSVLRALNRDEIETIGNDAGPAVQSVIDALFQPYNDPFSTDVTYDTISTDTVNTDTVNTDTVNTDTQTTETLNTATGGSTVDTTSNTVNVATSTFWFDCLSITPSTSDAIGACIRAGVTEKRFKADDIPGPYLYPKCGLLEYYNSFDIYSDSAQKYADMVKPHIQCIVDAATKEGVDLTYSSPEFLHPDCYKGVNPFNYADNSDAISAAFECATIAG